MGLSAVSDTERTTTTSRAAIPCAAARHCDYPKLTSDQYDEPKTIPGLRGHDGGGGPEDRIPGAGYPAGDTEPYEGLTGDEGRVNAEATPGIADDAAHGQTESPVE